MLIILNAASNGGRGAKRWARVEKALRDRGTVFDVVATRSEEEGAAAVAKAIAQGHREVIAAGGDGTVNGVANALLEARADLALGAIGLGSSNDFHKPFSNERRVAGVPVRLDAEGATRVDVGRVELTPPEGKPRSRSFLLNASAGAIAYGNAFFNAPDGLLRWLKPRQVDLAITYAALRAVFKFKPIELSISRDGQPAEPARIGGLSILKRVNFAGSLRYDTPVQPDDGTFDLNYWDGVGSFGMLQVATALSSGKFLGRPGTHHHSVRRVKLSSPTPFDFELDGEVQRVVSAEAEVVPRALRVCV